MTESGPRKVRTEGRQRLSKAVDQSTGFASSSYVTKKDAGKTACTLLVLRGGT